MYIIQRNSILGVYLSKHVVELLLLLCSSMCLEKPGKSQSVPV